MADLVGLNVQSPDMMAKLGQLMQLKSQQTALQGAQQSQRQRAALAAYDFTKHLAEDGTPDVDSMAADPELRAAAGDQIFEVLNHASTVKGQQLNNKKTLVSLRNDQRQAFSEMMGALRGDPDIAEDNEKGRQKITQGLIQFGETYGEDALPVLSAYSKQIQSVPKGKLDTALKVIQMQAVSAAAQAAKQSPEYLNRGPEAVNINPYAAPGDAKTIKMDVSPSANIVTDANGRQFLLNPQKNTVTPIGTGASPGAPTRPAESTGPKFTQPVPGQETIQKDIETVRKADSDYGTNRHVNDEILRLSADTSTGPGTKAWHSKLGAITGLAGGNQIADFQKIGAYLDRQAALSSQQMGLPDTNAGLQTAANLSGTTEYTPEALQTKVQLTDAMVEGAHQYRQGLDKVVGTGTEQDLSKYQQFRSQWADNFDPYVFRAENALRRKDAKELAKIKEEVGADGLSALKKKSDNLRKLASGQLL